MAQFSVKTGVKVVLAYYPPYHSKYNPVERVFGVLENYWNGTPLKTVEQAKGMAEAMTYGGLHPNVSQHKGGATGKRLLPKAMKILEQGLERMDTLRKWLIEITPGKAKVALEKLMVHGHIPQSGIS